MSRDPRAWPITIKVPLAVATLMVLVGLVLSERVLARLTETQERHLRDLSQSYLDGLSSAIAPSVLREDVWEVFDAVERAQALNKGLNAIETVVTTADGTVIAASDPRRHPVGSILAPVAASLPRSDFSFDAGSDEAHAVRVLSYPGRTVGIIHAAFDTRHLAAERQAVLLTLALTNGLLTLLLAAGGWLLVSRMMRPVRTLTEHLGAAAEPEAAALIATEVVDRTRGEFGTLFRSYNALIRSMREREDLVKRLAEEERLGSLGRLASAVAHEINNPLGGLFNALSTLKTHGHLAHARSGSIGLLDRGLIGIRDVVRTTLAVYRVDGAPRPLIAADLNDLRILTAAHARRKSVSVVIGNDVAGSLPLPSTPIRQAVLNLLLNAVSAAPEGSVVALGARVEDGELLLSVADAGAGLPPAATGVLIGEASAAPLVDSGGLGLWTTRRLVADLGGAIDVELPAAGGTIVRLRIPFRTEGELADVA